MTGSANVWIVFIEFFAVVKDQVDIDDESLQILIPEKKQKTYINHFLNNISFSEFCYSVTFKPWRISAVKNRTSGGDRWNSLAAHKLLTYGGEVHWLLDDLPVARDWLQVDGWEERPCILMPLQLSKEYPDEHTHTHTHTHTQHTHTHTHTHTHNTHTHTQRQEFYLQEKKPLNITQWEAVKKNPRQPLVYWWRGGSLSPCRYSYLQLLSDCLEEGDE